MARMRSTSSWSRFLRGCSTRAPSRTFCYADCLPYRVGLVIGTSTAVYCFHCSISPSALEAGDGTVPPDHRRVDRRGGLRRRGRSVPSDRHGPHPVLRGQREAGGALLLLGVRDDRGGVSGPGDRRRGG